MIKIYNWSKKKRRGTYKKKEGVTFKLDIEEIFNFPEINLTSSGLFYQNKRNTKKNNEIYRSGVTYIIKVFFKVM